MRILKYLTQSCIIFPLECSSKEQVIKALAEKAASCLSDLSEEEIYRAIVDREELGSTAVGGGVAIPHAKVSGLEGISVVVAISRKGVPFDAMDSEPVHVIFMLLAPEDATTGYLRVLAKLARLLKDREFIEHLVHANDISEILGIIERAEDKVHGVLV